MALEAVGSNPTNHPMNNIAIFLKKNKIKRRRFKKKIHLISKINSLQGLKLDLKNKRVLKRSTYYREYIKSSGIKFLRKVTKKNLTLVGVNQKKFNPKCSITTKKILNTFSVGSITKYFKVKQAKYIRRSLKGLKIFLNFLKNCVEKFYLKKKKLIIL